MRRAFLAVVVWAIAGGAAAQPTDAARFADPVSARSATLSPSGDYAAYVSRDNARQHVVVVDLNEQSARGVMSLENSEGRINWVEFKGEGRIIVSATVNMIYEMRPVTGSNRRPDDIEYTITRVLAIDRDGGNLVQMFEGRMRQLAGGYGSTFLLDLLPRDPQHVLLSAWDSDGHGVWRADVTTGAVERIAAGSYDTIYYATDGAGQAVMRVEAVRAGYRISRRPQGQRGGWETVLEARHVATATNSPDFEVVGPGPGEGQVYVIARPDERDLAALYLFDTRTGQLGAPLQEGVAADVDIPWINPTTREIFATCEFAQRLACRAADSRMQRHLNAVSAFFGDLATVHLVDLSDDAATWLLRVDGPTESGGYYVYDRNAARLDAMAPFYPNLDTNALSPVEVVTYRARDGTELWAYVTARPGVSGPRPMVIMPHGGPESRDHYGYDAYSQFLASRGYVVVQPNFRGSLGFGQSFADAGRGQWGRRMQDDVTDAVRHMIDTGVADANRICIVGASYGGYAALAGAALTPDLYRCAIAISPVTDLIEMLREERADGGRTSRGYMYWIRSIGDPRADRDALLATSPVRLAANMTAPVLLIHGETDEIVLIEQSERMSRALEEAGRPSRFVQLPDSGHRWDSWSTENRLTVFRETESFLAQHLGVP